MISGRQIRAARGLLGWSQFDLAREAGVSPRAVYRVESSSGDPRVSTLEALEQALIRAGIEFLSGDGKGEGVRFSKPGR